MNPSRFKDLLKAGLLNRGRYLEHRVEKDKLLDFLKRIRPIDTGIELIRLGGEGDGGYLVPNDLTGISQCFSPGVGDLLQFDRDLASLGIKCHLIDGSIERPANLDPMMVFEKKYLKGFSAADAISLDDWVASKADSGSDLILEMDIEGAEFEVLLAASRSTLQRFRIMVIEFHFFDRILGGTGFEYIDILFQKLLQDFEVAHIHPNNTSPISYCDEIAIPRYPEFTFIRKDRVKSRKPATLFPHPLDRPNLPELPDIALPVSWYKF